MLPYCIPLSSPESMTQTTMQLQSTAPPKCFVYNGRGIFPYQFITNISSLKNFSSRSTSLKVPRSDSSTRYFCPFQHERKSIAIMQLSLIALIPIAVCVIAHPVVPGINTRRTNKVVVSSKSVLLIDRHLWKIISLELIDILIDGFLFGNSRWVLLEFELYNRFRHLLID